MSTLGELIDKLYALRTERLEVEGKVEEMKSKERALREEIAKALTESGVNGATGQVANARKTSKTVATVKDWGLLWQYIKDHDAFDMVANTAKGPLRMIGAGTLSRRIRSTPPGFNELTLADGTITVRVRNLADVPTPAMQIHEVPENALPPRAPGEPVAPVGMVPPEDPPVH